MKRSASNKWRLSLITGLMMALVMAITILVLNLVFSRFIESQAHQALKKEAAIFLSEEAGQPREDSPTSSPVTVHSLFISKDGEPQDDTYAYALSSLEKAVLSLVKEGGVGRSAQKVTLMGEELYVLSLMLYTDEDLAPAMAVLYANVSPLKQFLLLLNTIFFAILLGFGALATYLGLRLGRAIDDSQNRMRRFFANASHELKRRSPSFWATRRGCDRAW